MRRIWKAVARAEGAVSARRPDAAPQAAKARKKARKRQKRATAGHGAKTTASSVLVRAIDDSPCVSTVLYTDFRTDGKIQNPTPDDLAARAIQSVREADEGKDGISYLMNAIGCGIETPLTPAYRAEILKQTAARSLEEAIRKAKGQ